MYPYIVNSGENTGFHVRIIIINIVNFYGSKLLSLLRKWTTSASHFHHLQY